MSDAQARIAEDVKTNDVLLYMKGTPAFPQCGFSAMTVQILTHVGVKFKAQSTCWKTRTCARASRPFPTGRPFPSCM